MLFLQRAKAPEVYHFRMVGSPIRVVGNDFWVGGNHFRVVRHFQVEGNDFRVVGSHFLLVVKRSGFMAPTELFKCFGAVGFNRSIELLFGLLRAPLRCGPGQEHGPWLNPTHPAAFELYLSIRLLQGQLSFLFFIIPAV